jgi:DNA-binding IclR family transcriptional regulator
MSEMTATVFGSLASSEALAIVVKLLEVGADGATVTELHEATDLPQPTVTRNLQALAAAGLLTRDRTTKAYAIGTAEDVRRLLDQASEIALRGLQRRTTETEALQRRVRKSRLSTAKGQRRTGPASTS